MLPICSPKLRIFDRKNVSRIHICTLCLSPNFACREQQGDTYFDQNLENNIMDTWDSHANFPVKLWKTPLHGFINQT